MITSELGWSTHIDIISNKANSTLGFLRRNLKYCPRRLNETAYMSLVWSKLEYCASIWDPHLVKDIDKIERVNRRAARFVSNDYRWRSSVTSMLQDLEWRNLASRRKVTQLALFYKIVHQLVAVPTDDIHALDPTISINLRPLELAVPLINIPSIQGLLLNGTLYRRTSPRLHP